MKDMERQKFENDFKNAFEQAGITPSENLWTGIELDLEKAESKKMRRTLFMYKLMAAASITFAMFVAGAYYYTGLTTRSTHELADNNIVNNKSEKSSQATAPGQESKINESVALESGDKNLASNNSEDRNALATDNNRDRKADVSNQRIATSTLKADNSNGINSEGAKEKKYSNTASEKRNIEEGNKEQVAALSPDNSNETNLISNKENSISPDKLTSQETKTVIADANKAQNSNITSVTSNNVNSILSQQTKSKEELVTAGLDEKKLPPIVSLRKAELDFPSVPKPDPFAVMMAKLELREKELMEGEESKSKKKKTVRSEKLWTSVGFAAGSFNSSSHTTNNGSAVKSAQSLMSSGFNSATSSRVADNESSASGSSYTMGLNLGAKITNRWIMQGGVNYLMQNSSYQTNVALSSSDLSSFRAASIGEFKTANSGATSDNKVVSTAMYSVNNNSQFVSIPVQAGYLAVNRKVGLQINAGVSTDLFMKNIKDPQGVTIETTTQGRGSDSPYRPLNFSGLFGTELSYKLGQHYRLAINPGLRYPFNSIYKSGVGVTSNPLTMDIGMRFRYIFR
ncbi:MAG TPA: outer membrane beta-barrel protein [Cyclobacteriaceae bacterium]